MPDPKPSAACAKLKRAADGTRLYYARGPWSRPYLVPDADTASRLTEGESRLTKSLGILLLVILLLGKHAIAGFETNPWWVGAFFLLAFSLQSGLRSLGVGKELRRLRKTHRSLSAFDYYVQEATGETWRSLLVSAMGFTAICTLGLMSHELMGRAIAAFCGLFAIRMLTLGYIKLLAKGRGTAADASH